MSIHSSRVKEIDDECIELQEKLISIDPLRQERYEDRRKCGAKYKDMEYV